MDCAVRQLHLDPHPVAEAHERRLGLALLDRLQHPPLGNARRPALAIGVRHRARPDDRSRPPTRASWPRARSIAETKTSCRRRRWASRTAAPFKSTQQRQMHLAVAPMRAQFVRRHRHRRKRRRRLRLKKTEPLLQFLRNQIAQADVVDQHQQPDMRRAACAGDTPICTSPVIAATSPSISMPHASSAARMSSSGPMKLSDPP